MKDAENKNRWIIDEEATLTEEDMAAIAALDTKTSAFFSHSAPNMVEWFVRMVEERKLKYDSSKEKKNW